MKTLRLLLFLAVVVAASPHGADARAGDFRGWASFIVAGDWTDSEGETIEAFDNARRDLATAFERAGFERALMADYTLNPERPDSVAPGEALQGFQSAATRGTAGCLIYLTSHGSPARGSRPGSIVFGPNNQLEPAQLRTAADVACGQRPTVIVISACFSGGFIPALAEPNRMIITAARMDRSSFGCGGGITYPYFDDCVLQALETATDFIALAHEARGCVAAREQAEGLSPPSEPQVVIGGAMQLLLPTLRFDQAPR
ncbi:MAG: hypothetical protein ACI8U3_002109 [Brevundimonas sp.]|jgi:hypothetical protein|uniref:C13 family peptidase n=1 Tax=Brevundimonas sp. TaxID=1871086 RepID=UPI0039E61054